MNAPLFEKLNTYKDSDVYPFHMPGHKMGRGIDIKDVFAMDITEIDGFDNLHHAEGVIDEAQKMCAKTFGAEESFFIVNGSSSGIIAAIMSICGDGEKIIIARNSHKSVMDGLVLSGANPSYVMPEIVEEYNVFGAVSTEEVEKVCNENPEAKAVIIVSPTFEGIVSDIDSIANIVHQRNMLLIVDSAHGPHMHFNSYFPKTAIECGADIVIESLHKTLPCPTQASVLHISGTRVNRERLKKCLAMVQTSSPSYIFMAAIDKCRDYLDNQGKTDFESYVIRLKKFREDTKELKNLRLMDDSIVGKNNVFDYDLGKLVFFSDSINCIEIGDILRKKYKIELEMSCPTHCIAMTSVSDTQDGFDRLRNAIIDIDKTLDTIEKRKNVSFVFPKPVVKVSPRIAFYSKSTDVCLKDSIGEISAEYVIPYPPGIPLISPGEKITAQIVNTLDKYINDNVNIIGMKNSLLEKISVLM
ncbi:MAG: aminotransferase class V-fold PLP-dependent enzyme [Lachnospiraceae bacterium]|nr:aminotransferase class V-fold PLP-dependent enzyme [Lachnospiraceae bacterium]